MTSDPYIGQMIKANSHVDCFDKDSGQLRKFYKNMMFKVVSIEEKEHNGQFQQYYMMRALFDNLNKSLVWSKNFYVGSKSGSFTLLQPYPQNCSKVGDRIGEIITIEEEQFCVSDKYDDFEHDVFCYLSGSQFLIVSVKKKSHYLFQKKEKLFYILKPLCNDRNNRNSNKQLVWGII